MNGRHRTDLGTKAKPSAVATRRLCCLVNTKSGRKQRADQIGAGRVLGPLVAMPRHRDHELAQQLRQLGDIRRDPSRLIFGEQRCVGATAASRMPVINESNRLPVLISHNEIARVLLGGPWRREAAIRHLRLAQIEKAPTRGGSARMGPSIPALARIWCRRAIGASLSIRARAFVS